MASAPRTLCIDIGGTGIKTLVLDAKGKPVTERARIATPRPATPRAVRAAIVELARKQGAFDRVAVGFPGVVRRGVTETAFNLHPSWIGVNLERLLSTALSRPVRAANDADVQGLGAVRGKGVELVITLGTGFGSALFIDGRLVPNVQLAHHAAWRRRRTRTSSATRAPETRARRSGTGGSARRSSRSRTCSPTTGCTSEAATPRNRRALPPRVKIISNLEGLLGGIALWESKERRDGPAEAAAASVPGARLRRVRVLRRDGRSRLQEDLPGAAGAWSGAGTSTCRSSASPSRAGRSSSCASARARSLDGARRRRRRGGVRASSSRCLRYIDGDYRDPATFAALRKALGGAKRADALPGHPAEHVRRRSSSALGKSGCADGARVVDREAVRPRPRLGAGAEPDAAHGLPRAAIFRIDHYLGKEAVQNLLVLPLRQHLPRADLEPQLRRERADHDGRGFGVQGRGKFYEEAGAIRDVIQNHLLQVVGFLAMEPPITTYARVDPRRAGRRSSAPSGRSRPSDLVRGQFRGYREEPGVAAGLDGRDLRGRAAATSTPGAGTACRSSSAPASACR